MISVTEGDDKPLKYPHMFAAAGLVLINKIDLAPLRDFDLETCLGFARSVNPGVEILPQSPATSGDGLDAWYDWIRTTDRHLWQTPPMSLRPVDKAFARE